jgi:ABC-type dipeptide/oligopeptide/nickel transport system ATPase component
MPNSQGDSHNEMGTVPISISLRVEDLTVDLGGTRVLDRVGFTLAAGETLGLVGESGSGKTLTALALLRLLPPAARVTGGRILLGDEHVLAAREPRLRKLRGGVIAMVFQEPMTALNPVLTIGTQLERVIVRHRGLTRRQAHAAAIEALARVGIAAPAERLAEPPHRLSGGMRQRVAIAMALACEPAVLVADEPTTALDVTTQAQVLDLIVRLQSELRMAMLLVTHDLAVVAGTCARVAVMHAGRIVEEGRTADVIAQPCTSHTQALLAGTRALSNAIGASA